jgi:OOP family OmpA-OmpF porin
MKSNIALGKIIFAFSLTVATAGCSSSDKKTKNTADSVETTATTTTAPATTTTETVDHPAEGSEIFKDFDWNTVPQSTAEIGAFPYISAPAGFYIGDKDSYSESKTGYSKLIDFNKLIIFSGQSFYNAEGKVAKLKFHMKDDADWNQYGFDSCVDKYLASIGAKQVGKLKLTDSQTKFLNKDNEMTIYNHIVGDPYNDPVRFYALNHPKGKIMFQIFSNTASGEAAVVQLAAFEQTIKAPKAVEALR